MRMRLFFCCRMIRRASAGVIAMNYHGKVVGPSGQVYLCEHNHRTLTAAITCANSSATRRMAAMKFNRAAVQAAQAAALAKKRAEERAAEQARRIAAQEAAAARRAAAQAAAEEAKAAKRAAKLASMSPQRAWRRMTPEERLLSTAASELEAFGEILSPDAKAAYVARAVKHAAPNAPAPLEPGMLRAVIPPRAQAEAEAPEYSRALEPNQALVARSLTHGRKTHYEEAYQHLMAQVLANLAKVEDGELSLQFIEQAAESIRSTAREVPEFYVGEFIQMLGDAVVQRAQAEVKVGEQAIREAQTDAAKASVELSARYAAASAAGDRSAVHSIWGEREKIQAANQAKVDAVSARADVVALQIKAFEILRSTIGTK